MKNSKEKNSNLNISAHDFLRLNKNVLSQQDKIDLCSAKQVYYYKENNKRKLPSRLNLMDRNNTKDTCYQVIPHEHINFRYEVIHSLGEGSFGHVVYTYDHKEQTNVAVKVIRRDIRFTNQAQEEIRILEKLKQFNPNPEGPSEIYPIVKLLESFMFRDHMCLTFELLGMSLYDLLKKYNGDVCDRGRIRRLMSSVLDGLIFIRNAGIIHCDLKPENILLVKSTSANGLYLDRVKIIDFGSSCFLHKQCYPYIQSRFYRAPEVIFRLDYSQPIDMWSFGCLVFEMIKGIPLFPGEDEFDQLSCMMEKLGMPPTNMLKRSRVCTRYFVDRDQNKRMASSCDNEKYNSFIPKYCNLRTLNDGSIEMLPNISKRTRRVRKIPGSIPISKALAPSKRMNSFSSKSPNSLSRSDELDDKYAIELMEACLCWLPEKRIGPTEAKSFSWFKYNRFSQPCDTILTSSKLENGRKSAASETNKNKVADANIIKAEPLWFVKKQRSPASISSGENKQEERIICARRPVRKISPTGLSIHNDHKTESATNNSDISPSSSSEIVKQSENRRYTKRCINGAVNVRKCQTNKRNQSVENWSKTQPIINKPEIEVTHYLSTNDLSKGEKIATDPSEEEIENSGRHNPNYLSENSKQYFVSRVQKLSPADTRSAAYNRNTLFISNSSEKPVLTNQTLNQMPLSMFRSFQDLQLKVNDDSEEIQNKFNSNLRNIRYPETFNKPNYFDTGYVRKIHNVEPITSIEINPTNSKKSIRYIYRQRLTRAGTQKPETNSNDHRKLFNFANKKSNSTNQLNDESVHKTNAGFREKYRLSKNSQILTKPLSVDSDAVFPELNPTISSKSFITSINKHPQQTVLN